MADTWPTFVCVRCSGSERLPVRPPDGVCASCAAPAFDLQRRFAEVGVPFRYRQRTRESWEAAYGPWATDPVFKDLAQWRPRRDWLLVLYGAAYGQRKTGAGTAVFGELLGRGARGRWLDHGEWVRRLRDERSLTWSSCESEVWAEAATSQVLLLDDLGGATLQKSGNWAGDWWRERTATMLRRREACLLPTIVTANVGTVEDFGLIHPSLVSRMDVKTRLRFDDSTDYRAERQA